MDIAVVANPNSEGLSQGTYEAIAFAAALAGKADAKVTLWLLGADCQKGIREAARLPIEAAICAEHGALADYMPETYLDALTQMQQAYRPDMIVFSGDIAGREISVRLACRADTQAVNDCIAGDYQDGAFVFTKSVYSGNLFIRYVLAQKPAIVSIRNGVFDGKGVKRTDGSCIVRRFEYAPKVSCSWVRHRELKKKANDLLSDARIVVIGGRGIGRRENFGLLQRFAEKIGAAVGGTRPAVNNGWLPVDALVGQSGKNIAPELCIVIGASGATPFLSGITGAKTVVAINIDPYAPIFKACHLGVLGDYREIIKHILEL